LDFVTAKTTSFGERHQVPWLMYSPLQMLAYHRLALRDANPVVSSLLETFPDAMAIADVGCGSGAFSAEMLRRGRSVKACEHARGGRLLARLQGVEVTGFDLDCHPPAQLPSELDLAYCFEVAEHCTPAQGDHLVSFLAETAPAVVFTAAAPGQGGLGHINEQDQEYWITRFADRGMAFSESMAADLRARFGANGVLAPWFSQNVMVFKRESTSG
jgi:SAM-dependent methyltransferase